ncbi:MAG TPA: hypothetical protein PLE77_02495 [Kiritimatiellia bacterium]|nr:hypothetical protein [Kiritimatiellia bacterium]
MNSPMQTLRWLGAGETRWARAVGILAVMLVAGAVRLWAMKYAYPAPMDVVHYVQSAVELAHGNSGAWNVIYPPASQALAFLAEKHGWSSAYVLQGLSVFCSVAGIVVAMLLAYRLFGAWPHAWLTGLFLATNPTFTYYSVNGYSDVVYAFFLLLACWCAVLWFARDGGWPMAAAAFGALGLGGLFRMDESQVVALLLAGGMLGWTVRQRSPARLRALVVGGLVFAAVVSPVYVMTYKTTGRLTPGVKFTYAFAMGDSFYDSKEFNAIRPPYRERMEEFRQAGLIGYLWSHRAEVSARWVRNLARLTRTAGDTLFTGTFRAGPGWLAVFLAGTAWMAARRRAFMGWGVCLAVLALQFTLISFFMAQARYLVPSMAFAFMLFADAGVRLFGLLGEGKAWRILAAAMVLTFGIKSAAGSIAYVDETDWYYHNGVKVGEALRRHGGENDVLMTPQYCVALGFYDEHPLRMVKLGYGTIEETEAYADKAGVDLVALTDSVFAHWPIGGLFRSEAPPAGWKLLDEIVFTRDSRYGVVKERYLLFRRERPARR